MIAQDMAAMIESYNKSKLSEDMKKRIEVLIVNRMEMIAAELEQLAIEHETTEGPLSS